MKKILNILMIASVLLFVGCEDEISYEKGPLSSVEDAVYFLGDEMDIEIEPTDAEKTHEVTIVRTNYENALTVPLKVVTNTDNVFKVPETISFDAGEEETTIEVTYQGLEAGKTYYLQFEVDQSKIELNPYKDCSVKKTGNTALPIYNASITPIAWSETKMGVLVDGMVLPLYELEGVAWYVEYRTADLPSGKKKVRLLNPYNKYPTDENPDDAGIYQACPWNAPADIDATKDYNFNMEIDGKDVSITDAYLGITWMQNTMMRFTVLSDKNGKKLTGTYDANAGSIVFEDDALVIWPGNGKGYYASLSFFFTKEAYVKYVAESGEGEGDDPEGGEGGEGEGGEGEGGEGEGGEGEGGEGN